MSDEEEVAASSNDGKAAGPLLFSGGSPTTNDSLFEPSSLSALEDGEALASPSAILGEGSQFVGASLSLEAEVGRLWE